MIEGTFRSMYILNSNNSNPLGKEQMMYLISKIIIVLIVITTNVVKFRATITKVIISESNSTLIMTMTLIMTTLQSIWLVLLIISCIKIITRWPTDGEEAGNQGRLWFCNIYNASFNNMKESRPDTFVCPMLTSFLNNVKSLWQQRGYIVPITYHFAIHTGYFAPVTKHYPSWMMKSIYTRT